MAGREAAEEEVLAVERELAWKEACSRDVLASFGKVVIRHGRSDGDRNGWYVESGDGFVKSGSYTLAEALDKAVNAHVVGRISYDDEVGGHFCTGHGLTVETVKDVQPTESGSWFYRCRVCRAGGWSGL